MELLLGTTHRDLQKQSRSTTANHMNVMKGPGEHGKTVGSE